MSDSRPAIRFVEGGVVSAFACQPANCGCGHSEPDWKQEVERHAAEASLWRERARNAVRRLTVYGARIEGPPAEDVVDAIRILMGDGDASDAAGNRPPFNERTPEAPTDAPNAPEANTAAEPVPATQSVKVVDFWQCEGCGEHNTPPLDINRGLWRFNGRIWQHYCPGRHPQAGPADARPITDVVGSWLKQTPPPILSAWGGYMLCRHCGCALTRDEAQVCEGCEQKGVGR